MLNLYTWSTQNARKISIMLKECDLSYKITPINIEQGEHHTLDFKTLNPNSKIPVLLDSDLLDEQGQPVPIFETGAILLYLAEKTGRFIPKSPAQRYNVIKWLFWQTSNLGPVFGNFSHFASALVQDKTKLNPYLAQSRASEPNHYSIERFTKESFRLLHVMESVLAERAYIADEQITIADFACYTWIESAWAGFSQINPEIQQEFQHISSWMQKLADRPGARAGMNQLAWGADLSQEQTALTTQS